MQIRSNWDLILSWWTVCHELTRSNTTHNLGVISGSCQGHLKVNSINPQRRLAFRLGRWLLTYLIFQYMSILCEASGWRFTFCAFCRMTINEICPLTTSIESCSCTLRYLNSLANIDFMSNLRWLFPKCVQDEIPCWLVIESCLTSIL